MAVWNVIDHTEVSSTPTSDITKTGLSTSYDHMYFLVTARFEGASAKSDQIHLDVRLGTSSSVDSGSNYTWRYGARKASSATVGASNVGTIIRTGPCAVNSDDAAVFAQYEMWIVNYANTANYKQLMWQGGRQNTDTSPTDDQFFCGFGAGSWANTGAVDSVKLMPSSGTGFTSGSTLTIYGLNGDPS